MQASAECPTSETFSAVLFWLRLVLWSPVAMARYVALDAKAGFASKNGPRVRL